MARRRAPYKGGKYSSYPGITYDNSNQRRKRWKATIITSGKIVKQLGRYAYELEAAEVYRIARAELLGPEDCK